MFFSKDVDPTQNVLSLVEAAVKRLDDLQLSEFNRINKILELHITYIKELSEAESKRHDSNRLIDQSAAANEREKASSQAQLLANNVVTSAETLRNTLSVTASTLAQQRQLDQIEINKRLAQLEKLQNEESGRTGLASPFILLLFTIIGSVSTWLIIKVISTH